MKNIGIFFGLSVLFIGINIILNLIFSEPINLKGIAIDVILAFIIYLGIQFLKGRKTKVTE